jgi:hypothetical protein
MNGPEKSDMLDTSFLGVDMLSDWTGLGNPEDITHI